MSVRVNEGGREGENAVGQSVSRSKIHSLYSDCTVLYIHCEVPGPPTHPDPGKKNKNKNNDKKILHQNIYKIYIDRKTLFFLSLLRVFLCRLYAVYIVFIITSTTTEPKQDHSIIIIVSKYRIEFHFSRFLLCVLLSSLNRFVLFCFVLFHPSVSFQ